MEVRRFNPFTDWDDLQTWFKAHAEPMLDPLSLPSIRMVCEDDFGKIAMAFFRPCEGNVVLLEGLVTNPARESFVRNRALDILGEIAWKHLSEQGFTKVIAWTGHDTILSRALRHGFIQKHVHVMTMQLGAK